MMHAKPVYAGASVLVGLLVLLAGCTKTDAPTAAAGSDVPVKLSMSFGKSSGPVPLLKTLGTNAADSLRIDSAVVVVERIRFIQNIDSVTVGTSEEEDHGGKSDDSGISFRGPFVIRVRDTLSIDLGSSLLPPGTYDGVVFRLHRLGAGEKHEEGDDHRHPGFIPNDAPVIGSSVVVWGAVLKNGVWTPFMISSDLEGSFKIRGNFVVQQATGTINFALHFNLGLLFRDPITGAFLDPTDLSGRQRDLIRAALAFAFGSGRGGHDRNDDGHPDD